MSPAASATKARGRLAKSAGWLSHLVVLRLIHTSIVPNNREPEHCALPEVHRRPPRLISSPPSPGVCTLHGHQHPRPPACSHSRSNDSGQYYATPTAWITLATKHNPPAGRVGSARARLLTTNVRRGAERATTTDATRAGTLRGATRAGGATAVPSGSARTVEPFVALPVASSLLYPPEVRLLLSGTYAHPRSAGLRDGGLASAPAQLDQQLNIEKLHARACVLAIPSSNDNRVTTTARHQRLRLGLSRKRGRQ